MKSADIRVMLEEHVNARRYLQIEFNDGSAWVFFPAAVRCQIGPEGSPRWITVGLRFDSEERKEDYAVVLLDSVRSCSRLDVQPMSE